jgi:hypothetical protein
MILFGYIKTGWARGFEGEVCGADSSPPSIKLDPKVVRLKLNKGFEISGSWSASVYVIKTLAGLE